MRGCGAGHTIVRSFAAVELVGGVVPGPSKDMGLCFAFGLYL